MFSRQHRTVTTPIGTIVVEADDEHLHSVRIGTEAIPSRGRCGGLAQAAADQIEQWFANERQDFALPLAPTRTARGEALRQGLIAVPFGSTCSYGELALKLGSSARAIGQLCARNPFPIIVPCHRVTGAGGVLGFYSAGDGPATKQWLLQHEQQRKE